MLIDDDTTCCHLSSSTRQKAEGGRFDSTHISLFFQNEMPRLSESLDFGERSIVHVHGL